MDLSQLRPPKGRVKKTKRRGRGQGSGHGKTSCRGHKGAKARSGPGTHMGFEGGQMPLIRRIPKRGFTNADKLTYQVVNIDKLKTFGKDAVIDAGALEQNGMIKKLDMPIKILGAGEIDKPLTVKVNAVSGTARKKIETAGGKIEIV